MKFSYSRDSYDIIRSLDEQFFYIKFIIIKNSENFMKKINRFLRKI
jgi:hypothetical protein